MLVVLEIRQQEDEPPATACGSAGNQFYLHQWWILIVAEKTQSTGGLQMNNRIQTSTPEWQFYHSVTCDQWNGRHISKSLRWVMCPKKDKWLSEYG